jgi:hypothetical protein
LYTDEQYLVAEEKNINARTTFGLVLGQNGFQ